MTSDRHPLELDGSLLSDLWIFRAAARSGSISAAAQILEVTASAVSQRVLRLEARLGAELFRRQKSKITLTEAGSLFLEAMNDASLLLNSALSRIDRPSHSALVVSCVTSLATEWLMPHLQAFYREHPHVELMIRAEMGQASMAWMQREHIDVLIHYSHAPADDLCEIASLQEFTWPVCSRPYRGRLDAMHPKERAIVLMHDDDAWGEGEASGAEWQEWLAANKSALRDVSIKAERHFNLAYLAYKAAMYGEGVALGRAVSVHGAMKAGSLVPALDLPPVPSAHYRIVSRTKVEPGSAAHRFATWMASALMHTQRETFALLHQEPWSKTG
jgi:LysR family D-serine deaminase transcriptional activator